MVHKVQYLHFSAGGSYKLVEFKGHYLDKKHQLSMKYACFIFIAWKGSQASLVLFEKLHCPYDYYYLSCETLRCKNIIPFITLSKGMMMYRRANLWIVLL